MDRRKSLKILATGALASGALIGGCKETPEAKIATPAFPYTLDRNPAELKRDEALLSQENIFTLHEMATITVLADIIIPKDETSGSASDAKTPDFIEFICRDMPQHEIPMKGGLRWLDMYCLTHFQNPFKDCNTTQQIAIVDQIAYPEKAKPEMSQGVAFFSLMRNLTATGFYSSAIGSKDVGYIGNAPNKWNGVPDDVLKQYNLSYTEKELNECAKYDK